MTQPAPAATARPDSRERLVFTAAVAVIALHVLVVSLVTTEPNASRLDHLPWAMLSLVVLGLATGFYDRLGAGLRAAGALLIGGLAAISGFITIFDVAVAGLSADDWTGFLLVPAGLVLLGLGGRLLWVSRKHDRRRWLRRALLAVGAVFAVYWVVLPIGLSMYATSKPREPIDVADYGRAAEAVTVRTRDGLTLTARYVPSQNGAAVIVYPGGWATRQARMLVANGYGVLLLDPRGYGGSEGDPNAFGWGQTADIDAAVAFLEMRPDIEPGRVGGLGLSVGGEQMIEAAAGNPDLKAVVSEGAGLRSARESFARRGVNAVQVALQWPHDAVLTAATTVLSGDWPPPSLVDSSAGVSPRAVFFIYGENGQEIEKAVGPVYFEAAKEPKEIWEVPGAGHTGGAAAQPDEYEQRIVGFFDEHLFGGE